MIWLKPEWCCCASLKKLVTNLLGSILFRGRDLHTPVSLSVCLSASCQLALWITARKSCLDIQCYFIDFLNLITDKNLSEYFY